MFRDRVLIHSLIEKSGSQDGGRGTFLHNQGEVFVRKVMKTLCSLLNVHQLKTTAYDSQTNGILDRWHGYLKGMLRKQEEGPRATQSHSFPCTSFSMVDT